MEKFDSLMKRIHSPEIEETRTKPLKNIADVPHSKPQENLNSTMLSTGGINAEPKKPIFETTSLD